VTTAVERKREKIVLPKRFRFFENHQKVLPAIAQKEDVSEIEQMVRGIANIA
jgi:hypothetical protein